MKRLLFLVAIFFGLNVQSSFAESPINSGIDVASRLSVPANAVVYMGTVAGNQMSFIGAWAQTGAGNVVVASNVVVFNIDSVSRTLLPGTVKTFKINSNTGAFYSSPTRYSTTCDGGSVMSSYAEAAYEKAVTSRLSSNVINTVMTAYFSASFATVSACI